MAGCSAKVAVKEARAEVALLEKEAIAESKQADRKLREAKWAPPPFRVPCLTPAQIASQSSRQAPPLTLPVLPDDA
jgi:hypothetical protein